MTPKNLSALSDTFRIAEYDTYFKSHAPYAKPPKHKHQGRLLDKHASLVASRWVYPLVCVYKTGENFHIPFEAQIDNDGVVIRGMPAFDPTVAIDKRSKSYGYNQDAPFGLEFPKLDAQGRAVMVRLFLSPYRLSKSAAKVLCTPAFQEGAREHIPSLWGWHDDPISSVKSVENYYLDEHDNWLTIDGKPQRVWVGVDPFHVAQRRSDVFVRRRKQYVERFEPREKDKTQSWAKEQLMPGSRRIIRLERQSRQQVPRCTRRGSYSGGQGRLPRRAHPTPQASQPCSQQPGRSPQKPVLRGAPIRKPGYRMLRRGGGLQRGTRRAHQDPHPRRATPR